MYDREVKVINGITLHISFARKDTLETIINRDIVPILLRRPDLLKKSHGIDDKKAPANLGEATDGQTRK